MRKLSLLLGTLGGAMAGYVFSNTKLREELSNAKDAEAAGKILAKHLQKDGKQIGKEVKKFVESDDVQANLKKAKQYVAKNAKTLQSQLKGFVKHGKKHAKQYAAKGKSAAKRTAKKAVQKAESTVM